MHLFRFYHINKLQELEFTLKKSKCEIGLSQVSYLGFVVNSEGSKPNPLKVKAIIDATQFKDITQVCSFLGMLNFYRKVLPKISTKLEKLNRLLDVGTKWHWSIEHETALKNLNLLLLNSELLVQFHHNLPVVISDDSSSYSIDAALCHLIDSVERPVMFISEH